MTVRGYGTPGVSGGLSNVEVAELYRAYGHLVLRRCRMVLRDARLAEDALQEVFIKLMRYGVEIRAASSKLRWLYTVADRCCFDLLDRRRRQPEPGEIPPMPGPHPDPMFEARDRVLAFLAELDDESRRIALLAFVDGMSQGEIASELGLSRQTINKKLMDVKRRAGAVDE